MKRSELTLLVGALTLSLGFGACASTYIVAGISADVDKTGWSEADFGDFNRPVQCREMTYDDVWTCESGPISMVDLGSTKTFYTLTTKFVSNYPPSCKIDDWGWGNFKSTFRIMLDGAGGDSLTWERGDGNASVVQLQSKDLPGIKANQTSLVTNVPMYLDCDAGLGEFEAKVFVHNTARPGDNLYKYTRYHQRNLTVTYRPEAVVTGFRLEPSVLNLSGTVGKYVETETKFIVDVKDVTKISVEWPAADMVEYENEGKWSDHLVRVITTNRATASGDQKIRLRSATPLFKTISLTVKVTVE